MKTIKAARSFAGIPKPAGYRRVLEFQNAKTSKGEKLGFLTGILYLAPATEADQFVIDALPVGEAAFRRPRNVCVLSTEGCRKGCLYKAGRASFTPSIVTARIRKTHRLFDDRALFLACLRYDIRHAIGKARRMRLKLAIRVNGTSDLAWMALLMAAEFPRVQFYDYTKLNRAWERVRANYHLTFSHSESNAAECTRALAHGLNIAVVFDVKRGQPLPATFMGARVIDGDLHDLRFLDGYQSAVIGLRAKGPAKQDCSGFVVKTSTLVQITLAA